MQHKFDHGTIHRGDCLELMRDLPDHGIDMILADLPYGTIGVKWDVVIPFEPLWEQFRRILKPNGVSVFTGSQPFTTHIINSNMDWFRYEHIWDKVSGANFMNLKNAPLKTHENILIFSETPNFTFNPIRTWRTEISLKRVPVGHIKRDKAGLINKSHYSSKTSVKHIRSLDGMKHPVSIIKYPSQSVPRKIKINHCTPKPVKLFEYLIETYTNKGDTVLDPVIGSGTTAVAAYNTGRRFIGMEKDAEIYESAVQRIDRDTKQLRLF